MKKILLLVFLHAGVVAVSAQKKKLPPPPAAVRPATAPVTLNNQIKKTKWFLFFLVGLSYHGVYMYLSGQKPEMPVWAFIACAFFSVTLLIVLPAYVKVFLIKNKR